MPRVDCPKCGVVVAAEPGSRFTRDFEAECAWLMSVANQKTVSGFLHVAWRTAGDIARRVADRLKASMPSPFDGLTSIGVDEASYRKGHTYITVVLLQCLFDRFGSVFPQCGLMVFPGVVIVSR